MKLTNEWISGFVDGDGCFSAGPVKDKKESQECRLRFRFLVSQDQRSADVLYALKKHFACGTVYKSSGHMMDFCISNRAHLRDKVLPHFVKYPLQTMKRVRFQEFASTLYHYMERLGENGGDLVDPLYSCQEYQISPGWLAGIADADGCFSFSYSARRCQARFTLAMQRGEGKLLEECQRFLNCGTLHKRKNGLETWQISRLNDLEKQLIPLFETRGNQVLLRTIKRISFQKWRKIVRLMGQGEHLNVPGLEKILKYKQGLNKHNQSMHHAF